MIERVSDMQQLYAQSLADLRMLQEVADALPAIKQRMAALDSYYQQQWADDSDALSANKAHLDAHYARLPKGHYSVMGEDTLWNHLDEYHRLLKGLIQQMADAL